MAVFDADSFSFMHLSGFLYPSDGKLIGHVDNIAYEYD